MPSEVTLISYADDTVMFIRDGSWDRARENASLCLNSLKNWFDCNKLTLNLSKTNYLPISCNKRNLPHYNYILIHDSNCDNNNTCTCNSKVMSQNNVKYLGIYIDSHLRWETQTSNLIKKLRSIIYYLKRVNAILNITQLKTLYHALVESHLSYGIIAWGGLSKTLHNKIDIIQKKY